MLAYRSWWAELDRMIAIGDVHSTSDRFIWELAEAVQSEVLQGRQIDRLTTQTEHFAAQLSRDLEKLVFVRQLSECLSLSHDRRLSDVAELLLPNLLPSVDCEWIVFIGSRGMQPMTDCVCDLDCPIIEFGNRCLTNERLIELVGTHAQDAMTSPWSGADLGDDWPEVDQLLLVRVFKWNRHWGWLVAVNRRESPYPSGKGLAHSTDTNFGNNEASLVQSAAGVLSTQAENLLLMSEREGLLVNVVRTLVSTIEAKDPFTRGHSDRVAIFSKMIGAQMGLSQEDCDRLYLTGLLHDIGKIGVPDATLKKTTALTADEFEQIKRHPEDGWAILQGIQPLQHVLPGVLYHHERIDGNGYPDGLEGDSIPLDGRILAVADAYDAMTSDRSYRSCLSQKQAEDVLRHGTGIQWDQAVVEAFFALMPEVIKVRQTYSHRPLVVRRRGSVKRPIEQR